MNHLKDIKIEEPWCNNCIYYDNSHACIKLVNTHGYNVLVCHEWLSKDYMLTWHEAIQDGVIGRLNYVMMKDKLELQKAENQELIDFERNKDALRQIDAELASDEDNGEFMKAIESNVKNDQGIE